MKDFLQTAGVSVSLPIKLGGSFLFLLFALACSNAAVSAQQTYQPNWESLSKHNAAPEWFQDAKLGIYFHWGPYTVAAYGNEWYPRKMHEKDKREYKFHLKNFGPHNEVGYHDMVDMFKAEQFDPAEWAELFQSAGAKFAGPVAQHHDGFAMWHSEINPWNVGDKGPQRDVLGELFSELKKRDMKTIATFHHARHGQRFGKQPDRWEGVNYASHYPYSEDLPTSSTDPELRKLYGNFETVAQFEQFWLDQVNEVVDKYSPDIIWYDSWLNIIPEEKRQQMAAHFFNHAEKTGQEVVTCHKQADMPMSFSVLDFEQGGRRETHPMPWMTDITLSTSSWSYVEKQKYKSPEILIRNMIDVWSKNGIVLLNISPRADGVIVDQQRKLLKQLGQWLEVHGEAVYETRPFIVHGFGSAAAGAGGHGGQSATVKYTKDDIRFTEAKDGKSMFLFFLGQPEKNARIPLHKLVVHRYSPRTPIKRITLLGTDNAEVKWKENDSQLFMTTPDVEMNSIATVFKLELE